MKTIKAQSEIGTGIIVLAAILLLGGIFLSGDDQNSKSNFFNTKSNSNNTDVNSNILFSINNTDLGREKSNRKLSKY